MSDYDDKELALAEGSPYFLYEFNVSDNNATVYRYTDAQEDITWNSLLWTHETAINHSEIKQSSEISKNGMTFKIPIATDFGDLFKGWSPDHIITVNLRRGHYGISETRIAWKGRLASHTLKEDLVELKCESIFTSMRRPGVRARFQRNCRHSLYGRGCGLDKDDFAVDGILDSVSSLVYSVSETSAESDQWYRGGFIKLPDGSTRLIVNHVGADLTIDRKSRHPIDNLAASGYGLNYGNFWGGYWVKIYPGCDRTLATCNTKFGNSLNQGGFKWIPSKNPMGGSSIV